MKNIIEVKNLNFGYAKANPILKDVSFEVAAGKFIAVAGPNGAGKTTLLNLLCGLLRKKTGTIKIDSENIESYSVKKLAQKIAVVRQEFVPVFDFSVIEMVSTARTPYLGAFGFESKGDKKIIADALEATDTVRFATRALIELSGGERQRVFIARALAQNTDILLLDEPTSFLDLKHQVGIYDLLKKMQLEKGKTIIAVTHDINLAAQYCDKVLLVGADGSYQYGTTKEVFSWQQIKKTFGINVFTSNVGKENFFLPIGKFAKDSNIKTAEPHNPLSSTKL
ncbi:MAG: ABC transporter ATP-binding protein [Planctomycetes bacterium]|nr:ABC transporter ATP-binding protein [Planctomycetota bacterium]